MNTNRHNVRTIPMLVLVAGLAMPAIAQQSQKEQDARQRTQQPDARSSNQPGQLRSLSLMTATDLIGKDIKNIEGETLGSIDDAIVDRGSGRIAYLVVQSGAILGFGGERVAIPYNDVMYDTVDRMYTMPITAEDLQKNTNAHRDRWVKLNSGDLQAQLREMGDKMYSAAKDAYASAFGQEANRETISGTVVAVNRWNQGDGVEYVSVDVMPAGEDSPKTIVLGPSWYVMGSDHAPVKSHKATVTAVRSANDTNRFIATGYGVDGNNFAIRSDDGKPMWNDDGGALAVFMLSDLIGMNANARNEDGGEIQNAIVEAQSGQIGLVVFDPNENFLGLGDDLYPVPWSEVAIGTDRVTIDADAATFEYAETLPDDVSDLTSEQDLRPMYEPFGTKVTVFTVRHRDDRSSHQTDSRRGG